MVGELRSYMVHNEAKHPPANAADIRDVHLILGGEDPLEEGMATHSSISCLENPMDRGAWRATVYRVAESDRTEST